MSIPRSSINDYPEHLNPFYEGDRKFKFWKFGKAKRSGSLRESLRNSLLFKSIRGKKSSKETDGQITPTQLRRNVPNAEPSHRQTLPTIYSPNQSAIRNSTPVLLPRSRFSERVTQSPSIPLQNNDVSQTAPYPFGGNQSVQPTMQHYPKRKKRRAPLPPSSDGCSVSSEYNHSKWSLNSEYTDMSAGNSDTELTLDPEVSSRIAHITEEIQKLGEEEDHPKAGCDDAAYSVDIPDVVVSSIDGIEKAQSKDVDAPIDENYNVVEDLEDGAENKAPDVLHHTNCNECADDGEGHLSSAASTGDGHIGDSLTNLINSINVDNTDENDFELRKVDSLTIIINSINFTENEAFESKFSSKCDNEVNGNCDNETTEASLTDKDVKDDMEKLRNSQPKEDVNDDRSRT